MIAICVKDCHGPVTADRSGPWLLFHGGQQYEIGLDSPCIVHFQALPGASPEDVQALTKAQRAEIVRGRGELEHKRAAKTDEEGSEDFSDFKLPMPDKG